MIRRFSTLPNQQKNISGKFWCFLEFIKKRNIKRFLIFVALLASGELLGAYFSSSLEKITDVKVTFSFYNSLECFYYYKLSRLFAAGSHNFKLFLRSFYDVSYNAAGAGGAI